VIAGFQINLDRFISLRIFSICRAKSVPTRRYPQGDETVIVIEEPIMKREKSL
jgi:hypothetical protein